MCQKNILFFTRLIPGLGNAVVSQLIYLINDHYHDWKETALFLSGILFTIVLFGSLFRPAEFTFHRKDKNYHHTMNDMRLPPSCMTSMEKLQRFIHEMDKQRASRHASHQAGNTLSHNDRNSTTVDDNDTMSIGNESDLFDSYSADDITEIQDENQPTIDMVTFREKISNDMTFLNERWRKFVKKQSETNINPKLFQIPTNRYLISTKPKERSLTVNSPTINTNPLIEKVTSSAHHLGRDRTNNLLNEQQSSVLLSSTPLEENLLRKDLHHKSGEYTTV